VLRFSERKLSVPILTLLFCLAATGSTPAQSATPAAYPVAPDPSECIAQPASPDEIATVLGTAFPEPSGSPAGSPAPFVIPPGRPADTETSTEVMATLRQLFACANAGDALRVASFYTDDFVRDFFGGVPVGDLLEFLAIGPEPLSEAQKRIIIRFGQVQILPSGRAGVVIVLDEPDDPRIEEPDFVILEQVDGRWLVDEIHEDPAAATTSVTGTPLP
jgi:hypothetical protein